MNDFKSKLNRLMAAAAVNQRFRQTLLANPAKAVEGYGNEKFGFTASEHELILSIRATTLEEFASQVQQLASKTQDPSSENEAPKFM